MDALLIRTEGYALQAEVELEGRRLIVMDDLSPPGGRRTPGPVQDVALWADEFEGLPWEETFSGNPAREKRLEPLAGWSYMGYGQVVSVDPMVVDLGFVHLRLGPPTRDPRCIGEFVKVKIGRLTLSARTET